MGAVKQSGTFMNSLLEAAPDAMLVVSADGRIALANKRSEELFGYPRAELIDRPIEVLIPDRFHDQHRRDRAQFSQAPAVRAMGSNRHLLAKTKSGDEIPVDIMLSPLHFEDEMSIIATVRDASERRMFEEKLATSEAMFRALYDQSPDAIIAVDHQGRIIQVNRRVQDYFGYSPEELLHQDVEILLPERLRQSHIAMRDGYIKGPKMRPMGAGLDLYACRKDKSEFPVDIMLSPVHLAGNYIVIGVIRDISERKAAEKERKEKAEQLERSNQELEQFAYIASHDLQEPLRAVAASVQFLKRKMQGQLDADLSEYIDFAVDGAKRMQDLINDLLSYSRLGRWREFEPVPLDRIVDRVLTYLRTAMTESGAEISRSPLPTVKGDASQLVQLLQNLLSNALKFRSMDRAPRIHISAQVQGGQCVLSVQDNGIGIQDKYREKIFEIFQRLHPREDYPGTGIGLAICKKIAQSHGGRIWFESQPGVGTRFYVCLPLN